jgi:hypothetical protein
MISVNWFFMNSNFSGICSFMIVSLTSNQAFHNQLSKPEHPLEDLFTLFHVKDRCIESADILLSTFILELENHAFCFSVSSAPGGSHQLFPHLEDFSRARMQSHWNCIGFLLRFFSCYSVGSGLLRQT